MKHLRCLFCKQDSSASKSVEHIIPESLGNSTLVLPVGYVCDKCNNYFARKVEKPFLEQQDIKLLRFQEAVLSKKKRIPPVQGILNNEHVVEIEKKKVNNDVNTDIKVPPQAFSELLKEQKSQLIIPAFTDYNSIKCTRIVSRFIAKMALEALAAKLSSFDNSLDTLVDDVQFDPIRDYARLGTTKNWPCSIRRIYSINKKWNIMDNQDVQVIHESDFLFPSFNSTNLSDSEYVTSELYFIIILWGIEFTINMGGPELEGYEVWLRENNNISPLYYGKNSSEISD